MLDVLPRIRYTVEDKNTRVINKDPSRDKWDPHTQDIVTFLGNMMKMWLEENYSLETRHNYLLRCLPFCETHLEAVKYDGLYTKQLE